MVTIFIERQMGVIFGTVQKDDSNRRHKGSLPRRRRRQSLLVWRVFSVAPRSSSFLEHTLRPSPSFASDADPPQVDRRRWRSAVIFSSLNSLIPRSHQPRRITRGMKKWFYAQRRKSRTKDWSAVDARVDLEGNENSFARWQPGRRGTEERHALCRATKLTGFYSKDFIL